MAVSKIQIFQTHPAKKTGFLHFFHFFFKISTSANGFLEYFLLEKNLKSWAKIPGKKVKNLGQKYQFFGGQNTRRIIVSRVTKTPLKRQKKKFHPVQTHPVLELTYFFAIGKKIILFKYYFLRLNIKIS